MNPTEKRVPSAALGAGDVPRAHHLHRPARLVEVPRSKGAPVIELAAAGVLAVALGFALKAKLR